MIKIALKHWIYEKCIDVLFKTIDNNFLLGHKESEFKPGDRFEYIFLKPEGYYQISLRMYNCTILQNINGVIVISCSYAENFNYEDNTTCKNKTINGCGITGCMIDTYRRMI